MNSQNLPQGWIKERLRCVVNPRGAKVTPTDFPHLQFIGMDHVEAHSTKIIASIPAQTMKSSASRFFGGDVLYGRLRPYLNKVAQPNFDGLASAEFMVFPNNELVRSSFLKYRLNARDFVSFASHLNEGDRPRVSFDQIGDFELLIPPPSEQQRIVAKIEELFSELDKGIESLKTARQQIKVYRQALLKHAFEGRGLAQKKIILRPFTDDCSYTLGELIQTLGQGWSPRCLEFPSQSPDEWGVIKTSAIQPLHFVEGENKQLPDHLEPKQHLEICSGDILITRAGPRSRVGISCIVKTVRPKLMVCDKVYRVRVHKEKISPEYLTMLLNSPQVLGELEKMKSGISDSGLNLTQDKFLSLKILVPDLSLQQLILDDTEEKLTNLVFLEGQIDDALHKAEVIRQSILKKAFSGQLVPQDSNDEPASVLLERIKAEKAGPPTAVQSTLFGNSQL